MCDPLTALAIAGVTAGASSFLQGKAADKVKKARRNVMRRSDEDIEGYRQKANESFQTSLKKASTDDLKKDTLEAQNEREQLYTEHIKQDDLLPSQARGSEASKMAIVKALGDAAENSRSTAKRRAAVDAYGDALQGRDITMNRSMQNITQQGDFARGRAGVTEFELEDANDAGRKYANLAGIVSAIGKIGPGVAGFGAGQGWWGGLDPTTGITWNSGRVGV